MDHHCVWLNNCVGCGNHRRFVAFVMCQLTYAILFSVVAGLSFSEELSSQVSSTCAFSIHADIEQLTDISLAERARLVHPWALRAPTWKSPPFITCRTFPAVLYFLHFSWHFRFFFPFFLCSFRVRTCSRSTAPRASPAPSRVSAVASG